MIEVTIRPSSLNKQDRTVPGNGKWIGIPNERRNALRRQTCIQISVLVFATLCGCAWGGYQVSTTPQGADVIVGGVEKGTTPVDLYLHKSQETSIVIKKEGFKEIKINVTPKMSRHLERLHYDLTRSDQAM